MDITTHIENPMGTFTFNVENKVIGGTEVLAVCTNELHEQLGIKTEHRHWIDRRISEYGYVENKDFIVSFNNERNCTGRPKKEVLVTLDVAKELAMLEKTPLGRLVRQYFIDVEKQLHKVQEKVVSTINSHNVAIDVANAIANQLRFSATSYLNMAKVICEDYGVPTRFIPTYVEQNPVNSLTDLLKERGIKSSARVLNPKLKELGILEQVQRKSTSSPTGTKQFWCLSEKGLYFGKNEASVHSPRETQPLYYRDKFSELLTLLGL